MRRPDQRNRRCRGCAHSKTGGAKRGPFAEVTAHMWSWVGTSFFSSQPNNLSPTKPCDRVFPVAVGEASCDCCKRRFVFGRVNKRTHSIASPGQSGFKPPPTSRCNLPKTAEWACKLRLPCWVSSSHLSLTIGKRAGLCLRS